MIIIQNRPFEYVDYVGKNMSDQTYMTQFNVNNFFDGNVIKCY